MVKYQTIVFAFLMILFLFFSFAPTLLELSLKYSLVDKNREFILEHNYYWPDFNLYLSKIRQAWEGRIFPVEKYTSEPHTGSLIQIFYVFLGWLGRILGTDPNGAYQLGRILLSPILLILIAGFTRYFFPTAWGRILAFVIVVVSGSFPKIYYNEGGVLQIENYMQWWSTIDNLQRISFIPHILFGQIGSLFLLYKLFINKSKSIKVKQLLLYIVVGNLVGIVFPPSLLTLYGVIVLTVLIRVIKRLSLSLGYLSAGLLRREASKAGWVSGLLVIIFTFPSLLYMLIITRQVPWIALVEAHRRHFMPVPLDQYLLGLGPVWIVALFGIIFAIFKRHTRIYPLIYWVLSSWLLAAYFSLVREQSPLRFTQTGVFVPLGLLAAYFFYQVWIRSTTRFAKIVCLFILILYILENSSMMVVSFKWQQQFITQRVGATIPPVPYPPQTTYPLTAWMDGIRFLRENTDHRDVVIAGLTAGNFIPAYGGNFVYFGQTNTVEYERKYEQLENFFRGRLSAQTAERMLKEGKVKYVFYSAQEKELAGENELSTFYPFLKEIHRTPMVTIYRIVP